MPRLPLTTSYWPADTLAPILDSTIGGVLRAAATRAPDQPALVAGDPSPDRRRQWRYGELLAAAERAAGALLARFQPGDRVAVWAGNCPEWVLLEFAAGLAGLTLVTVNPAYQAEELAHVLGHHPAADHVRADRVVLLHHGGPPQRRLRRPGGDRWPAAAADRGEDHRPAQRRNGAAGHDR